MTTSENQVRHLYVVTSADDITPIVDQEGALYFGLKDVDGKAIRSDLIANIMYSKATPAEAMQRKLKAVKIEIAGGSVVAGQDYIVRINYTKFISQSDEDTYQEVGMARAAAGGTASTVLKELAENLEANTKKQGLVAIKAILNDDSEVAVGSIGTGTVKAIVIREIEQPWTLGIKQEEAVAFIISTPMIVSSNVETAWATVDNAYDTGATVVGNGKKTADLEYFLMGERGDMYRNMGWPNVVPTRYLVDATKQYDYIDIHYAYAGTCEDVQKSEKDITLVMPVGANSDHSLASAVLAKINAKNVVTIVEPDEWNAE